jgi:tetratricopeptide (TPR) repeat protein
MKTTITRAFAIALTIIFSIQSAWATCGGGGGGGVGGISTGGPTPVVYHVPWRAREPKDPPVKEGLILYWFPYTNEEVKNSSLRSSRLLSLYAAQCVSMELADYRTPAGQKLIGDSKPPLAALVKPDGTVINKVENKNGFLKVDQVEKLVEGEVKQREEAVNARLKEAKEKTKAGDNDAAITAYRSVLEEKCMFPKKAKDAAKELKKLGANDVSSLPDSPIFEPVKSAQIERTMLKGLKAEINERYAEAERLYGLAHRMDPADPAPLRYLGELYRHHTGEWDKARTTFETILNMQADPLSRAVALHGLGKMTIHDGEFKKGLGLMEASAEEYPLALAYRNLAVYWNSERDPVKTEFYVQKALALDSKDPYNIVFAAVFMAGAGRGAEALKIARENEALLPASYNLAAIYAQTGQREKALSLLKRHFFRYERYQAVRAKEMMEARVDAVFDSIREDSAFMKLTSGADGKLPMPTMPTKGMGTGSRMND